ncbi:MAG: arginase [Bacteroidota bacterium]|nr:arginase [Bacteroidota bacterium]MDX5428642.1 arginase [Bacteroidota bacterium]MDX5506379.1 arginase [Bacteroidota bacterium]
MVRLISVMSELGAGTRGASLGLEAMRAASYSVDPDFFKKYSPLTVKNENDLLQKHVDNIYGKRIRGVLKMYRKISASIAGVMEEGEFPLVISGDHSNAGGTIAGIKEAFPDLRLGVVWIDAHADLHSPYTSPSGNMHGMPLATALGMDNTEKQINPPKDMTTRTWNKLKGDPPRVLPEDLVFIGVRSTEDPEDHIIQKFHIPNFPTQQLRTEGVKSILQKVQEHLSNCDLVYVSFDVDSMDPTVSRGTGTPVDGGLTEDEARELLAGIAQWPKVSALEFTEINPLLDDKGNSMGEVAFRLLKNTVKVLEKKRSKPSKA